MMLSKELSRWKKLNLYGRSQKNQKIFQVILNTDDAHKDEKKKLASKISFFASYY